MSVDDLEKLSGKKRRAKLDAIRASCQEYLRDALQPNLEKLLADAVGHDQRESLGAFFDDADPDGQTLFLRYPSVLTADAYVRPAVRIECGAKSALDPHLQAEVRPLVSDDVTDVDLAVTEITTIQPTRTFWDKVVILHGLRAWFETRAELRQEGQRISRHYYDLHSMFRWWFDGSCTRRRAQSLPSLLPLLEGTTSSSCSCGPAPQGLGVASSRSATTVGGGTGNGSKIGSPQNVPRLPAVPWRFRDLKGP